MGSMVNLCSLLSFDEKDPPLLQFVSTMGGMVNQCSLLGFDRKDTPIFRFIPAYLHQFLDVHYTNTHTSKYHHQK